MKIEKNCNNCAYYVYCPDRLVCRDCYKQSNWQPNKALSGRIAKAEDTNKNNRFYREEIWRMARYDMYAKKDPTKFNMDCREWIKDVIFNDPATIILWKDGSKTVVKTQDVEAYDPEKGFAMAIAKKVLGGQGNYYEVFKKWVPDVDVAVNTVQFELTFMPDISKASECIQEIQEAVYKHFGVMDKAEEDKTEE